MRPNRIILSKHEHPDARTVALEQDIIERCGAEDVDCLVVPPLYHLAESSKLWKALADGVEQAVLLGWLHPRAVSWLLHRHQIHLTESHILDLRTFADAKSAFAAAGGLSPFSRRQRSSRTHAVDRRETGTAPFDAGRLVELRAPTKPRWYPVVDQSRCTNCQHCLQFCLFGVYELDGDGKVQVRQPDQCKPGCPACARICPQSALMFPLYEKDAAIAGAPGKLVALDAAARRMFYSRTGRPCPACGQKVAKKSRAAVAGNGACPECGCPLAELTQSARPPAGREAMTHTPPKESGESAQRRAFSDLDDLVDQLDRAMQRRG